jgi:hypothetical protein
MESRAAVFTSSPQAVEVYQAGAWWAGELLGWRHEPDGSCQVRVRVTLGGVEETAWTDLGCLRLPERHLAVAPEPAAQVDACATQKLPRATSPRAQGAAAAQACATAGMPAVRDMSGVPSAPRPGGRRRAPEEIETAVAAAVPAPRAGGRRRAPEPEAVVEARSGAPRPAGRRRAAEESAVAGTPQTAEPTTSAAGRHRAVAPVDAGRHRKADTGLLPAVREAVPSVSVPAAAPSLRPTGPSRLDDTFGGRSRSAWSAVGEAEPELLTRPMRLSDNVPHSRRPRLDGAFTGA